MVIDGLAGPETLERFSMDTQIAVSLGTLVAGLSFFFMWHKDSKETSNKIQKLETEVEQLKGQGVAIDELKNEISSIKQTLVRIDTNINHLMTNND